RDGCLSTRRTRMGTATIAEPTAGKFTELDSHYPLTSEQIRFYREYGYIKLKNVLPAEVLSHYGREITAKVKELNKNLIPLHKRDTYGKAFLQVMNLWTKSEI